MEKNIRTNVMKTGSRKKMKSNQDLSVAYSFFVSHQCDVTRVLCVSGRFWAPQSDRHLNVDKTDNTEWYEILYSLLLVLWLLSESVQMIANICKERNVNDYNNWNPITFNEGVHQLEMKRIFFDEIYFILWISIHPNVLQKENQFLMEALKNWV